MCSICSICSIKIEFNNHYVHQYIYGHIDSDRHNWVAARGMPPSSQEYVSPSIYMFNCELLDDSIKVSSDCILDDSTVVLDNSAEVFDDSIEVLDYKPISHIVQ